jgi:hypothetical protein
MSSEETLWDPKRMERVRSDYATHLRYAQIEHYRSLRPSVGPVPNLFYGDSLTGNWPLQEFFPHHSILNRGIGGDSLFGLRLRLEEDVLAYSPDGRGRPPASGFVRNKRTEGRSMIKAQFLKCSTNSRSLIANALSGIRA